MARPRAQVPWDGRVGFGVPDWDKYTVVESAKHPELLERTIADIAADRGQKPLDTMLDLALDEPDCELRVRAVFLNDDTDEVAKLLVDEHCTLGLSDAGAHVGQLCDAPEPTDFLGNWVRDRDLMPIETAVRKLTGTQADFLGLPDRGYLREGHGATSSCSTPTPSRPARCVACATSRRMPSASPPISRRACGT